MTRTAEPSRATRPASSQEAGEQRPADVLVVFGITGDLAKVMTFRSLYRLEQRGLLDCPIVGVAVDDWTVDQLRERARESIVATGEQLDAAVFDRFAARLSYVAGDFGDAATYDRVADAISGAETPVFYLEIPPFLFGTVVKGLRGSRADDERPRRRREAVRPRPRVGRARSPTSCTSTSTSRSSTASTTSSGRWASRRSCTCASRTRCSSRSGTGTTSNRVQITMAESFGVEDRGHFYDPVGRAARRGREPPHAGGRRGRDGGAVAGGDPGTIKDAQVAALPRRRRRPTPPTTSAASTTDTSTSTGVAADSTTETYAALRLDIENWRWSGVPFFIRTGQAPARDPDRAAARLQAAAPARASAVRTAGRSRTSSS